MAPTSNLLMLAAQAAGINLFKLIGTWTEETFHLTNSTEVMENREPAASVNSSANADSSDAKTQYASLSDALEDNGVSANTIPSWWPAGFSLSQLSVSQMQNTTIIYSLYENEDESFTFSVRMLAAQENDPAIYEKDGNAVIQYKKGGVIHYIISNINTVQAIWTDDLAIYTMSGQLTKTEIEKMIDSIYER